MYFVIMQFAVIVEEDRLTWPENRSAGLGLLSIMQVLFLLTNELCKLLFYVHTNTTL